MPAMAVPVATTGPYDTPRSSATRFLVELAAWTAGPWAAAELFGPWAIIPAVVVLVGVPAIFSTPGDKRTILVATPGPVRMLIEVALAGVALISSAYVWPVWASLAVAILVAAMLATNARRLRWLVAGAPL